jgi:hypothetical protein
VRGGNEIGKKERKKPKKKTGEPEWGSRRKKSLMPITPFQNAN